MKKICAALVGLSLTGALAFGGSISITNATSFTYTQDFSALGTGNVTWDDGNTIEGIYLNSAGTSGGVPAEVLATTGGTTTARAYNMGLSGDADRALGWLTSSGTGDAYTAIQFQDQTGINAAKTISYIFVLEQWSARTTNPETMTLAYKIDDTGGNNLLSSDWITLGTAQTPYVLQPGDPTTALNGNDYQFAIAGAMDISISDGQFLTFRLLDPHSTTARAMVGVDSIRLSTGILTDVIFTNGTTQIGGNGFVVQTVGGTAVVDVTGSSVVVTNVTGGTLNVGGTNGSVTTLSGGTLNANATGLVVTNFSGGNIAVSNGVTVGLLGGSSSGVISGGGGIVKQGATTLTLSGTNTYTGGTTISNGTLLATRAVSLAGYTNAGSVVVSGGTLGVQVGGSGWSTAEVDALLANATKTSGQLGLDTSDGNLTQWTALAGGGNMGSLGLAKLGANTLILNASNSYTGGTSLQEGVLRLDNAFAAGSGQITQTSSASTLQINTSGTIANNMSVYKVAFLQGATLSGNITVNNATFDVVENETSTISGVIDGTAGVNKTGLGQLTLTGANTYTGATVVNAGILELASMGGAAAGATGSVSVAESATLLISQSNQVSGSATVTLSGGTIQRGAGVSEVFGNLNLTTDSFLDFGTGATGTLSFGTYTPSSLLTVQNFLPGNVLTFGTNLTEDIGNAARFSFQGDFTSSWDGSSSTFTITAIPEPSTYVAAAGLLGLLILSARKRSVPTARV